VNASWEWLLVVPVFRRCHLFEWWIHKNVMHRLVDVGALRSIYDRHTAATSSVIFPITK